jgi:putative transposase
MKYNPEIHKRKSIRLKGYDYSLAGLYFITICVQNRECMFGKIENGKMILNDAGEMIEKWYFEMMNKFSDIKCDEMIVMPNHFHCIVENVGADLCVCPDTDAVGKQNPKLGNTPILGDTPILGEHVGSPLHTVVQWFKTMTTNEYIRGVKNLGWKPFDGKLWQRNYYEHIIRNEQSYQNISNYIINNPAKWQEDKFYAI